MNDNYYTRGQFDPPLSRSMLNWYRFLALFLLGLSTGLMLTLTYQVYRVLF